MSTRVLAQSLYGLSGTVYLVVGFTVLLFRTGLLPDPIRDIISVVGQGDLNSVHLIQEFGTALVFLGLITFWFMRHYEQSLWFHWAMTTFWGLLALVHWYDVRGPFESVVGPLINSIPFGLFVAVGLVTRDRTGAGGGGETGVLGTGPGAQASRIQVRSR
jgi:hypothetical protein